MADSKKQSTSPKKTHVAGSMLDGVGWIVRQAALPIPELGKKKKKKKEGKA